MKKIIATTAALACLASFASAQVSSANIVGYNKSATASGLVILSHQFDGDSTPDALLGDTLPLGSRVYQFTGLGYNVSEYNTIFLAGDAWDTALDLSSGSFWVESSAVVETVFSGEVPLDDTIQTTLVPGLTLAAYPYPVEVSIDDLDIVPSLGDRIYQFTGSGYNVSEYNTIFLAGDAWDTPLVFGVGEGFWYENASASTNVWIEAKPF